MKQSKYVHQLRSDSCGHYMGGTVIKRDVTKGELMWRGIWTICLERYHIIRTANTISLFFNSPSRESKHYISAREHVRI